MTRNHIKHIRHTRKNPHTSKWWPHRWEIPSPTPDSDPLPRLHLVPPLIYLLGSRRSRQRRHGLGLATSAIRFRSKALPLVVQHLQDRGLRKLVPAAQANEGLRPPLPSRFIYFDWPDSKNIGFLKVSRRRKCLDASDDCDLVYSFFRPHISTENSRSAQTTLSQ